MISYASVIITDDNDNLVTVLKNRPSWQSGRLNFVGGHVEEGETFKLAAIREAQEECGLKLKPSETVHVATITDNVNFMLEIFSSRVENCHDAETHTDETITVMDTGEFLTLRGNYCVDHTQVVLLHSILGYGGVLKIIV